MMPNIQKFQCLLALLWLLIAAPLSAQEISFSDSWLLLQQKNNSIAAQRANVDRYQRLEKAEDSLNWPTVTLGANYTRFDDDVTIDGEQIYDSLNSSGQATLTALSYALGTDLTSISSTITEKNMLNTSIRALWPIYTGGRITAAQNYAAERTDEARALLKMEEQACYEDLSKYYFSAVLAKEVLATRRQVEQGLAKHREFAVKLEEQGQIAKVERLQADASLAKAVVDRKKSEKDLEITTSALTEILNQSEKVIPQTPLFINQTLPPLSSFTEQTLATYPGLDILSAKEKQAQSSIKAEKGKYYPEVYLHGAYVAYEDDSLASELTPDWFVGIGVNLPLIDNSGRSHKVQAAQSSVLQVRHLREQAKQDLTVLVKKTYYEAQQAIEEVQGLDSSLTLAGESLRLRKKSFSQGLATSLDVIDAELYVSSIKTQQQLARFNYLISLTRLLALSSLSTSFSEYETTPLQANSEDKQ
jgi:outer membrane protein TolC